MWKILFFILIKILISYHGDCETIEVSTKSGKMIGNNDMDQNLYAFFGIPYAEPPLKDLRFKKPVPIKPWNEPLIANKLPNRCYQLGPVMDMNGLNKSENCLSKFSRTERKF